MTRHDRSILAAFFCGVVVAGGASAQSYGTGDQGLTLGAPSFAPDNNAGNILDDGYLYTLDPDSFSAPVVLPDGARITQICLYATNHKPGASIQIGLQAVKLAPGGLSPGVVPIPGATAIAAFSSGYDVACSGPISYEFHENADVDNDGTVENIAHRLSATFSTGSDGTLGLGGARIVWHRQVSPPPATATFTDVPTDHPFFQYVEALVAAGITAGVGNGMYGVNDPITRGQMAVFLSLALGLHWPY